MNRHKTGVSRDAKTWRDTPLFIPSYRLMLLF